MAKKGGPHALPRALKKLFFYYYYYYINFRPLRTTCRFSCWKFYQVVLHKRAKRLVARSQHLHPNCIGRTRFAPFARPARNSQLRPSFSPILEGFCRSFNIKRIHGINLKQKSPEHIRSSQTIFGQKDFKKIEFCKANNHPKYTKKKYEARIMCICPPKMIYICQQKFHKNGYKNPYGQRTKKNKINKMNNHFNQFQNTNGWLWY